MHPLGFRLVQTLSRRVREGGGQSLGRHPYLEYAKSERKDVIEKKKKCE